MSRPVHPAPPPGPRRHRLARLAPSGWREVLARSWDAPARDCLAHWARRGLPLVIARQPPEAMAAGLIALGLPAPPRWDRRRLALRVPLAAIDGFDEFPVLDAAPMAADAAGAAWPVSTRALALEVAMALDDPGATARVFGSHGWQALTGLDHVRPSSDLDLWIGVDDVAHADAVARTLGAFDAARPRLDGELVFGDGAAVAWREWAAWRAGHARAVLVKRIDGIELRHDTAWCAATAADAAPAPEPSP